MLFPLSSGSPNYDLLPNPARLPILRIKLCLFSVELLFGDSGKSELQLQWTLCSPPDPPTFTTQSFSEHICPPAPRWLLKLGGPEFSMEQWNSGSRAKGLEGSCLPLCCPEGLKPSRPLWHFLLTHQVETTVLTAQLGSCGKVLPQGCNERSHDRSRFFGFFFSPPRWL